MRKRILQIVNLPLVAVGVFILVLTFFLPITNANVINVVAWLLIMVGAVGYVVSQKRKWKSGMKLHARNDYTQNKQWLTSKNRQSHNNNKRGCAEKSSTASFFVFWNCVYFTVMWKHPCLTSYFTKHLFCFLASLSTSLRTHLSVSLRTCRRRGPSGSSTVL